MTETREGAGGLDVGSRCVLGPHSHLGEAPPGLRVTEGAGLLLALVQRVSHVQHLLLGLPVSGIPTANQYPQMDTIISKTRASLI